MCRVGRLRSSTGVEKSAPAVDVSCLLPNQSRRCQFVSCGSAWTAQPELRRSLTAIVGFRDFAATGKGCVSVPRPVLLQQRRRASFPHHSRHHIGSLQSMFLDTRTPTHAQAAPRSHLELHDRRADHREQPRRQREQLRRQLVVRHAGSDRRRRLLVPREQHRHQQLEPLQRRLGHFALARSNRQEKQ